MPGFSGLDPSGVNADVADVLQIDAPTFKRFVEAALHILETTNNGPLFALLAGLMAVLMALNFQITGQWPAVSEKLRPLVVNAKTVMAAVSPNV